jgi:uncharacterized protein (TIGR00645 family)
LSEEQTVQVNVVRHNKVIDALAQAIFSIKWFLVPLYIGLYGGMIAYNWIFAQEVFHILTHLGDLDSNKILLLVLDLIDMSMVGGLIVMTAVGGYVVDEHAFDHIPNKPRWLNGINSTTSKIKMGMALIGVSSVHLLSTFMTAHEVSWDEVNKGVLIHLVFCATTLVYVYIDKMTHGSSHD